MFSFKYLYLNKKKIYHNKAQNKSSKMVYCIYKAKKPYKLIFQLNIFTSTKYCFNYFLKIFRPVNTICEHKVIHLEKKAELNNNLLHVGERISHQWSCYEKFGLLKS